MNLGGFSGTLRTSVAGVGPDARHPFVLRSTRVWNSHWGFHTQSPNVLLDGYRMHSGDYAHWRQNFTGHAYRNIVITGIEPPTASQTQKGTLPVEADFPRPLGPVDDQPPLVIVTSTANGRVRGTAVDASGIRRLTCSGRPVMAKRPGCLEWEAVLGSGAREAILEAEDHAGNVSTDRIPIIG